MTYLQADVVITVELVEVHDHVGPVIIYCNNHLERLRLKVGNMLILMKWPIFYSNE